LSLREAFRRLYRDADVMACFSAGNIEHVASLGIGTHVMADHDESGRGEEAAIRTGLPYAMPSRVGDDANDLHREAGIDAVIELVGRRMT
jgi:putative DNA primase/helicase